MKILMVCLGNICRSPLAEGILQKKAADAGLDWIIDSAGTNGYHNGEHPHPLSQKVAMQHGINITKQISRSFVKEDFDRFDKIYAMASDVLEDIRYIAKEKFDDEKALLLLDEVFPGQRKEVPDPWSKPETEYHKVFDLLNKTCDQIINKFKKQPV
ncbi:low molecular weight protein-tyrosine-phosphatase [Ferruginibacter sp. SUN002]|uniref:low molecular weight protein-tyrosine-phosphatase n=1 Tax=Ferruginibacter sp. SUN002 TaxID=2937789 RepID=UPI003D36A3B2